jgi:hypothetical protein
MNAAFEWAPLLPRLYFILLGIGIVVALGIAFGRHFRDFIWRGLFFALLALVLLNPIVLHEVRQSLTDKLVIVMDDSASQRIGGRDKVAEQALAHIEDELKKKKGIEPLVIHAADDNSADKGESTNLFTALRNDMLSIPLSQVAGTVFITDGEVHDVPENLGLLEKLGPFHAVLTGRKDEFDRKVTIVSAPKYGLLNDTISMTVKVEQFGKPAEGAVSLDVYQDGKPVQQTLTVPGQEQSFTFKITHPGQNVFEFKTPVAEGELTAANNNAPVIVNGIRDRLKVLLVSGSPHMGERAWRNLLKSDPSIDLVHFTILRSPGSLDFTPQSELSLIAFPVDELFQQKINDFDLIIFDRYQQYGMIMMPMYFKNIANYIENGGAFLMALGTGSEAEAGAAFSNTALGNILPVAPAAGQNIMKQAYRPALSDVGKTHPVTADLQRYLKQRKWGQWYAQVNARQTRGQELMTGLDGDPLLVLDKVGKGRVAVLTSDNIWLWSKGLAQAGPYTELLRNVSHWLMKEPELEDDYIKADAAGNTITVSERDIVPGAKTVTMTDPSGATGTVTLDTKSPGWISANVTAAQNGIFSFSNGSKKAYVVVGVAQNAEFSDVHTTAEKLQPVVDATGGGIVWYQENRDFSLKDVSENAGRKGGDDWLGLKRNKAYTVDNVDSINLMPNWLSLLVILAAAIGFWWRESGSKAS